ncbi:MAG: type I-E CRISPR-associated protein Cas6/Cse3/CasE, partial [Verrucomicrobia bacterium]|nr:type I-E CRISPR-associated protein Cas6/Cse3/CasE [Verrucomicrobiota bacterium]
TLSQLEEWMERKASAAGFALEPGSLQISARGPTHFRKQKWRPPGTLSIVDFGGTLRVVDRRAFQAAFANGIGSAKAFGCGLLMLQSLD